MMKQWLFIPLLLICSVGYSQQLFQLAPPLLKYQSAFFEGSSSVEIMFEQPGAEVRYTLNGKEPTANDLLYVKPLRITKQTTLKAKAFGKNFLPSETVQALFIHDGKKIAAMDFSKPNEKYSSSIANILFDNTGGLLNIHNGTWLGYNNDTVTITIQLQKKEKISSVVIDMLQDEASWIFLPAQMLLYYYDEQQQRFLPAHKEQFSFEKQSPKQTVAKLIRLKQQLQTDKLKLVLLPLQQIPDWHAGKGNHAWLFIDEIKAY
ncbi:hypothetical protein ESA94_12730 [Lacibacter luteus]|uniref:GH29D-like beta-sandwich domain-containing protein n=1 Tax=Lacibacter luteus TaxID=2508719 RepID=A0A4Q1CIL7_9BACT|nr:chitobiase/beta-hexosaminidase C-terminal domain-containing protein [Lacibacter luteus]RXK59909.1 hypothetical protein ESA94_12730 [Lacibacter luteus]